MKLKKGVVVTAIVVVVVGIGLLLSITTIKQGHVGVVFSKNGGVIKETLSSGWHLINPLHKVTEYPTSLDSVKYKGMQLTTKDGQPVTIDIEYDYKNNLDKIPYIFETWKGQKPKDIEGSFLESRAKESAMTVTSKYTILEIFQNYEVIKNEIGNTFAKNVLNHGFMIENFVLGSPTPDEKTKVAIQAVVDAQQQLETMKIATNQATELAFKAKIEAESKAEVAKIEAQGKADSRIIEATAGAKANNLLNSSLTDKVLRNAYINKWNGETPKVASDGDYMLNLEGLTK